MYSSKRSNKEKLSATSAEKQHSKSRERYFLLRCKGQSERNQWVTEYQHIDNCFIYTEFSLKALLFYT